MQVCLIKSLEIPEFQSDIQPNEYLLFCADDFFTGCIFKKVQNAAHHVGAQLLKPLAVIANFYGQRQFEEHEIIALVHKEISIWDAAQCPLCYQGSPPLVARFNWHQLVS